MSGGEHHLLGRVGAPAVLYRGSGQQRPDLHSPLHWRWGVKLRLALVALWCTVSLYLYVSRSLGKITLNFYQFRFVVPAQNSLIRPEMRPKLITHKWWCQFFSFSQFQRAELWYFHIYGFKIKIKCKSVLKYMPARS